MFDGGVAVYPVEVSGASTAASSSFTQQRMKELALLTGGKAFYGSNDPFPDILQTSNGNTAGYELGYSADASTSPDFHRIEVTANQQSVQVAHPAGYFPYEGTPKSRAGEEIALAMGSPLEYTGIRFKITVAGIEEGSGGKKKVNLVISLPGNAGILNEAAGTVDVGMVALATNAKGDKVGTMNEGAGGKFPPEAVAQIKEIGFPAQAIVRRITRRMHGAFPGPRQPDGTNGRCLLSAECEVARSSQRARASTSVTSSGCSLPPIQSATAPVTTSLMRESG